MKHGRSTELRKLKRSQTVLQQSPSPSLGSSIPNERSTGLLAIDRTRVTGSLSIHVDTVHQYHNELKEIQNRLGKRIDGTENEESSVIAPRSTADQRYEERALILDANDLGGEASVRKRWFIAANGNVDVVIFTVDLGCYDQCLGDGHGDTNQMQENILLFDSVTNASTHVGTKFLLFFTQQSKLALKLKESPIEGYFPEYPHKTSSLADATAFFVKKFLRLERSESRIVHHTVTWNLPTVVWYQADCLRKAQ